MWNPSSLVPAGMRPWLLVVSFVLFLTLGGSMKHLVETVQPPPCALQFAWNSTRASEILETWSKAKNGAVRLVRLNLALDFVLIVIYVTGIALACTLAAGALDAAHWPGGDGMGSIFARTIIIAGLLDAVENVAQLLMLAGSRTQPWPALASVCASLKFFLIGMACLYALYGGAAFVCHYLQSRR
jgi:hypothetical protein